MHESSSVQCVELWNFANMAESQAKDHIGDVYHQLMGRAMNLEFCEKYRNYHEIIAEACLHADSLK